MNLKFNCNQMNFLLFQIDLVHQSQRRTPSPQQTLRNRSQMYDFRNILCR